MPQANARRAAYHKVQVFLFRPPRESSAVVAARHPHSFWSGQGVQGPAPSSLYKQRWPSLRIVTASRFTEHAATAGSPSALPLHPPRSSQAPP
jgi:hypothetical protein